MAFKETELFRPMSNLVSFEKEKQLKISGIENGLFSIEKKDQNDFLLIITSQNPAFTDSLKINFLKDTNNKLLKLRLHSVRVEMTCSKLLVNFENELLKINTIVELTN